MDRETKEQVVKELSDKFGAAKALYLADFRGISVEGLTTLRNNLRQKAGVLSVVKNTLAKKSIENTPYESLQKHIDGPTAIIFSNEDPAATAKVIIDFKKKNNFLGIKSGWLSGKILSEKEIEQISKLPSREELMAKILATFKAPHSGLVNTLSGVHRKLLNVLIAIKDKKTN